MKEKNVCFRMDEEVHHRAALKAKELGVTVSSLAKKFVYSIANNDLESNEATNDEKTDRLYFSLLSARISGSQQKTVDRKPRPHQTIALNSSCCRQAASS